MDADDWIKIINHVFMLLVLAAFALWMFGAFDKD